MRMGVVYKGMRLWVKASCLCVNQHLPGGGGWAWSIGLHIEIDKEWDQSVCLSENGSSLCV